MFATLKLIKNPFNQAIYLHNNLAYLQYFSDSNKRLARVMLRDLCIIQAQFIKQLKSICS
ncbi:MAG: hypothetical protein DRQ51_08180 [Gammaproteobacteria bacterium]|nr:MAG: hypothetical protein DRQ51_08180 [Gammaproteobacteria bacterium]